MNQRILSKLVFAGLLLGAGAVQAAGPTSVSEAPAVWYAELITTTADVARGAATPGFPAAAYEHGITVERRADAQRIRPGIAGMTPPFPSSPNESGAVL